MRKNRFVRCCFPLLLLAILTNEPLAQTRGLTFLTIGVGGRAAGMAEAYSAVTDGALSTFWNPAGLVRVPGNRLSLSHNEWFEDVRSEYLSFAHTRNQDAFGFSLNSTNVSEIEIRGVQPTLEPIATFDAHDVALGFSYARRFTPRIDFGITIRYLYEKIYLEETSGLAADFGVNYLLSNHPVRLAVVLQNLGVMTKMKMEAPTLPTRVRLGISYSPPNQVLNGALTAAADLVSDFNDHLHANIGLEYRLEAHLAFRLGYQSGYAIKSLHFGFGLNAGHFMLDYGYVPLKKTFGQGHRLSIGMDL